MCAYLRYQMLQTDQVVYACCESVQRTDSIERAIENS